MDSFSSQKREVCGVMELYVSWCYASVWVVVFYKLVSKSTSPCPSNLGTSDTLFFPHRYGTRRQQRFRGGCDPQVKLHRCVYWRPSWRRRNVYSIFQPSTCAVRLFDACFGRHPLLSFAHHPVTARDLARGLFHGPQHARLRGCVGR